MAEYIEREAALHEIERREALMVGDKRVSVAAMKSFIKNRSAADVAPVAHGRWKLLHKGGWNSVFACSVCGRREVIVESEAYNSALKMPKKYPYCHCGARMDGDDDG